MEMNLGSFNVEVGIVLPHWLLTRPDLSSAAKVAYALVLHYTQDKAGAVIDLSCLAARMGTGEEKIAGYLAELERRGLIEKSIEKRDGPSVQQTSSRRWSRGQAPNAEAPKRKEPLSRYDYDVCLEFARRIAETRGNIKSARSLAGHFYWTGLNDKEIAAMLLSEGKAGPAEERTTDIFSRRSR